MRLVKPGVKAMIAVEALNGRMTGGATAMLQPQFKEVERVAMAGDISR